MRLFAAVILFRLSRLEDNLRTCFRFGRCVCVRVSLFRRKPECGGVGAQKAHAPTLCSDNCEHLSWAYSQIRIQKQITDSHF